MKVLFAVSNDNITTSVVNKYQQKYKEIVTSKNVYYFNAIVKELQRDKSYDSIVIEEDLEPISNNNYEAIDRFLSEKLDSISDEAAKPTGEDIPIIFLCADRRTKSDQLMRSLFSMGIYNALIGNDRNLDKLCELIAKPRNKKDAKNYYQIETDQAEYKSQRDELVSEEQIKNIINYYKKIGTNERKCVQAFESISKQYDNTQLRIIVKFLPMDVKAILEAHSPVYQKLMSNGTVLSNGQYSPYTASSSKKPEKIGFISKNLNTSSAKPNSVVIPTNMKIQSVEESTNPNENTHQQYSGMQNIYNNRPQNNSTQQPRYNGQFTQSTQYTQNPYGQSMYGQYNPYNQMRQNPYNNPYNQQQSSIYGMSNNAGQGQSIYGNGQQTNSSYYNQNKQNNMNLGIKENTNMQNPQQARANGNENEKNMNTQLNAQQAENNNTDINNKSEEDRTEVNKPQIQNISTETIDSVDLKPISDSMNNTIEDKKESEAVNSIDNNIEIEQQAVEEPVKRRRGRPRKIRTVEESNGQEIKRRRGRPRKILQTEEIENIQDSNNNSVAMVEKDNKSELAVIPEHKEILKPVEKSFENLLSEEQKQQHNSIKQDNNEYSIYNEKKATDSVSTNNSQENNGVQNKLNDIQPINLYDLSINTEESSTQNSNYDLGIKPIEQNLNYDLGIKPIEQLSNNRQPVTTMEQPATKIDSSKFQEKTSNIYNQNAMGNIYEDNKQLINQTKNSVNLNLNVPIAGNGKIVSFVGTSKNGTSFIVNNLALLLSQSGINTAVVDLTKNRNSYYMFTDNDANKTKIATESLKKLSDGIIEGLSAKNNLTIFTALPDDKTLENINHRKVLESLSNRFEVILLDCDFETDISYFAFANEIYLIQSMDAFTIQPLTKFLSDLKLKNVLDENKLRVVINKYVKMKKLDAKMIVGGMSKYNEPSMTLQRDLFDPRKISTIIIPFDNQTYTKYLESIALCQMSLNGYSKEVIDGLEKLKNLVYPLVAGGNRTNNNYNSYDNFDNYNNMGYNNQRNSQGFSNNMNDTLNKMRRNNY